MTTYESASDDLITAVDHVIEGWLVRITRNRLSDHLSVITPDVDAEIAAAAREARIATITRLREVVFADVDAQAANPLQVLRQAVDLPAAVLRRAGVPVVERDEFDAYIEGLRDKGQTGFIDNGISTDEGQRPGERLI